MGVPSFYRWLVTKYPNIVSKASSAETTAANEQQLSDAADIIADDLISLGKEEYFDNLYLDMNGIIHPCFHPDDNEHDQVAPSSYEDVFCRIFAYIDMLFSIVRPRKLLYLAIDGVAPRAKMNQQRARRFRSAKDKQLAEAEEDRLRLEYENQGKSLLPKVECEVNDSNIITPGTEFMYRLAEALQSYISSRMSTENSWKDIKVILSDANVPGEGEHKIMSFIRQQRACCSYNPNTRHCLYGLDADLIMLALATHEVHFSLLREDVLMQSQNSKKQCEMRKPFEFLHIWLLREYLELDMKIKDLPENMELDIERIIDDFVFMCFFAGNDFLPHMPTLDIKEGAIDLMLDVYKRDFKTRGGYLIDMTKVDVKHNGFMKLKRIEQFITALGQYEDAIFHKRTELRERKIKQFLRYNSEPEDITNEICDAINSSSISKESKFTVESTSFGTEVVANTNELHQNLKEVLRKKSDLFRSGDFGKDLVMFGKAGWKRRYYAVKFSAITNEEFEKTRTILIQKYTEGLTWVLLYYYRGVPSWTWFYPFHYGPFASDFYGMSRIKVKFSQGSPFKPLDQLMSVLPPSSAGALPLAYQNLMINEDSNIIDFYPEDFEIDVDGKRFLWQGVSKLPFIDDERLLSETKQVEMKLDADEAVRNKLSYARLFARMDTKTGECLIETSIKLTNKKSEPIEKLDARLSCVCLPGFIWPFETERAASAKDCVHCVYYKEPAALVAPIYRPVDGVTFPDKTISEADIVETQLWHTIQSNRPQNANTRSFISRNNGGQSPSWTASKGRGSPRTGMGTSGARQSNNVWIVSRNDQRSKTSSKW